MKNLLKLSFALSLVLATLLASCHKKKIKKPIDETNSCRYEVTAMDMSGGNQFHFLFTDASGTYLLHAINYDDYKSKITPGVNYKIGFEVVSCEGLNIMELDIYNKRGGCWAHGQKCIRITCFPASPKSSCLNSSNYIGISSLKSMGLESKGIVDNALTAKFNIRSYNPDADLKDMVLHYDVSAIGKSFAPIPEVPVKIIHTNADLTVNAQYEREKCFDLTPIKTEVFKYNTTVKTVHLLYTKFDGSNETLVWNLK